MKHQKAEKRRNWCSNRPSIMSSTLHPSPLKKNEDEKKRLSPEQDLAITLITGISFKARLKLKKLLGREFDIFSSNRQFDATKANLKQFFEYEINDSAITCTNVKQAILRRIETIDTNGFYFFKFNSHFHVLQCLNGPRKTSQKYKKFKSA